MPNAGQIIMALDFTEAVTDSESAAGTTASVSFTATLTGGTACAVVFVAPTSGRVTISNVCQVDNDGANVSNCAWEVREGNVVGSGTVFLGASSVRALRNSGTDASAYGNVLVVTGLTAGAEYNVQQMFSVTAGTGTFTNKHLSVTCES